jgi:hypothetical protein
MPNILICRIDAVVNGLIDYNNRYVLKLVLRG